MTGMRGPISRFALEQYVLGEISGDRRNAIAAHLESCGACREALSYIENDTRTLPQLCYPPEESSLSRMGGLLSIRTLTAGGATLLVALTLALYLLPESNPDPHNPPAFTKGGDTSMFLVRERNGAVSESPNRFAEGDRFKLFVSRPGETPLKWDFVVFQGGEVYFPLNNAYPLSPGNRTPLPGALALDGDRAATLCLFIEPNLPSRDELRTVHHNLIDRAADCTTLEPSEPSQR